MQDRSRNRSERVDGLRDQEKRGEKPRGRPLHAHATRAAEVSRDNQAIVLGRVLKERMPHTLRPLLIDTKPSMSTRTSTPRLRPGPEWRPLRWFVFAG